MGRADRELTVGLDAISRTGHLCFNLHGGDGHPFLRTKQMNGESWVRRAAELFANAAGLLRGEMIFDDFDNGAVGNTEEMIYKAPEGLLLLVHGIDI